MSVLVRFVTTAVVGLGVGVGVGVGIGTAFNCLDRQRSSTPGCKASEVAGKEPEVHC